jgi:putative restriction endonuclease
MGYCVFMLRPDSIYDDNPTEKYQFPKQYLRRAQSALNGWIVYLEPKKIKNSRGYFALARVQQIIPDPKTPGMFLAIVAPGTYLDFACPVPFSGSTGPVERGLLNEQGSMSGRAQAAVRSISPEDFLRIVELGLDGAEHLLPRQDLTEPVVGFAEDASPYVGDVERQRLQQMTNRIVRDRVFRRVVLPAYDERCAITGLKFINGGGRAEVDAAHIKPVQHNGPDTITNGIALSGTAHWMFDRGLITLTDEHDILISRHVNDIDRVRAFMNSSGRANIPINPSQRPHPHYLQWHRENCFKA